VIIVSFLRSLICICGLIPILLVFFFFFAKIISWLARSKLTESLLYVRGWCSQMPAGRGPRSGTCESIEKANPRVRSFPSRFPMTCQPPGNWPSYPLWVCHR
jgi:hypothetical protein